ncbi:MAG: NAD(P)-binding protein, partial [Syntrophomonas sp.]
MKIKFGDHFVICSYNFKVPSIIKEIKNELTDCRIVLVADLEENPLAGDESVYFVRGDSSREATLEQANVGKARTVIVVAEQSMEDQMADAHSVLTALAARELNPSCRLVAESLEPENSHHLIHAGADEIVCVGDITAKLLSRTSIHKGMTKLISELMSNSSGSELYSAPVPEHLHSACVADASAELRQKNAILIGVYREDQFLANPPQATILQRNDLLIYIASTKTI